MHSPQRPGGLRVMAGQEALDGALDLSRVPAALREKLAALDTDGDGLITAEELLTIGRSLRAAHDGALTVEMFPKRLRPSLEALDNEGDGRLELEELVLMVEQYCAMKDAEAKGVVSVEMLPKELQPALSVRARRGAAHIATARGRSLHVAAKKRSQCLPRAARSRRGAGRGGAGGGESTAGRICCRCGRPGARRLPSQF